MRGFGHFSALTVAAAVVVLGPVRAQTPQAVDKAATVLAAAHEALGGEQKIAALKSFVASGQTRRLSGDNLVPVEFEIDVQFPDKYVRKDEIPARESAPSSTGFNGDGLIQVPAPAEPPAAPARAGAASAAAGRPGGPPPMTPEQRAAQARKARVTTIKQDFAKLTLGMFATSFSSYPLTFSYVGEAEAPQGKADVIGVKGEGNFDVRLFIASDTHLPIMISWEVPPTNVILLAEGQPKPENPPPGTVIVPVPALPPASAAQADKDKYAKDVQAIRAKTMAGTKVENRIYFAEYRPTDGFQFPYRLRHAVGTETIEETTFDRIKLNAKIDPKKFDVVK